MCIREALTMHHITPWVILLMLCFSISAVSASAIDITSLPFDDSVFQQSFHHAELKSTQFSSGAYHDATPLALYFYNVQYWGNVHYIAIESDSNLPFNEGSGYFWYKRPSDDTYVRSNYYVVKARNALGQITHTHATLYFVGWSKGSKTGAYTVNLYADSNGVKSSSFFSTVKAYNRDAGRPISLISGESEYQVYASWEIYSSRWYYNPVTYVTYAEAYQNDAYQIHIDENLQSLSVDLVRKINEQNYLSEISIVKPDGSILVTDIDIKDKSFLYPLSSVGQINVTISDVSTRYNLPTAPISGTTDYTLSLTPTVAAVGDPITASLTNIPTESSRLILNVNGVIHRDITNPYNFSAIGNSGETIYVFANCYDSSNNLLYSSNVVSYTLTGELEPIEPYPELEEVEITGVAPSYTQGNTLSASLDDNDIIGINEIWWKIIAQTDSNGKPSTITSKRYEFKELTSGNWQLKSGSSYTGSYTYADVKSLSHYIDGYGLFDVEVNCYNSTNGLIGIDRVNSYANPASYIKPVSVYIYGNSGLYSGEITLTTEYIVQSKNTTYYIYNGYESINVVKAGDYNIYVDLTDNSIYKDKVLQYCYDSDGSILRIYLEEDYTVSEHAKLSIRVVDSSGNPLSFANVHFIGLAESSMSTNANGYAEYIGINNETVKFTASKTGYISGEGSITLSDSINSFTLVLSTLTETITPTEASINPDEDEGYNPFTNFITAIMEFGFNEESAKIVVALGLVGLLFACGVKFGESTGAGLAGAVIGVIFSALLSLIPMWVIMAIILCAATILAAKFYGDR